MSKLVKKLLFIYNPNAGKGKIAQNLSSIVEFFNKKNYIVTVMPTRKENDAMNIVEKYSPKFDLLVCSGGDGTINEITTGLMNLPVDERRPCGYIPAGTTNDFATSLNIPKDMLKAAKLIHSGNEFKYDIGSLNDKFFTYIAGFGAFTDVAYGTSQTTKNFFGRVAYVLSGIAQLPKISPIRMKIETDTEIIEDDFLIGMVCNTYSVAGMINLKEDNVILDDGRFEAIFIKSPTSPLKLQETINHAFKQKIDSDNFYCFRSSSIKCTSKELIPWTVDGEFGGEYKEATITNNKQAVTFITDKFA